MQRCPTCTRTYPDDAPNFCPHDGTQLVSNFPSYNPPPSMANVAPPQMNYVPPYNQPTYVQSPPQAPTMPQRRPHNPMRKWAKVSQVTLIVSPVFLLLFLIMAMNHQASHPIAGLAAAIGAVGLIVGIMGTFIYRKQAANVDEMLNQAGNGDGKSTGGDLLAHWTYSPQEWSQFIQSEMARSRASIKVILYTVGLTFLVMAVGLLVAGAGSGRSDRAIIGSLLCLVVFGVVALLVRWGATVEVRKLKARSTGEVFISPTGLMLNESYYPWNVMGTRLTGVFYEQGNPNSLLFKYQQWGAQNMGGTAIPTRNKQSVRVPVPFGREGEAQNLVAHFPR